MIPEGVCNLNCERVVSWAVVEFRFVKEVETSERFFLLEPLVQSKHRCYPFEPVNAVYQPAVEQICLVNAVPTAVGAISAAEPTWPCRHQR